MQTLKLVVTTAFGLEALLAEELKNMGAAEVKVHNRAVACTGDPELMYRINYCSRVAIRVLLEIARFDVPDANTLYEEIFDVEWSRVLSPDGTFMVDSVCNNSPAFDNTMFASVRVKDAIADYFRATTGRRPSVDKENPDLYIQLHIFKEQGTLLLDSSGAPLFQRGYRKIQREAPLKENLAAALILLSGWDRKTAFIDPMCGSGTLIMEAALLASNTPAGFYRKAWAFQKWKDYDSALFHQVKATEDAKRNLRGLPLIKGSDSNMQAVVTARSNISDAGLREVISVYRENFENPEAAVSNAFLLFNPPYGERLKPDDVNRFYTLIGNTLKKYYTGCTAWIISPFNDVIKHIGLKPARRIQLFNGQIECRFLKFELYQGSRKSVKNKPE